MTTILAQTKEYRTLNEEIREAAALGETDFVIDNCLGQRYIGDGLSDVRIQINGTPGNGLGAYLDGAEVTVYGNAQDAVGDTMNEGSIIIHGSCGDAAGYAMRGGEILIRDNVGYRAGIHMKAYQEKLPVLIVGGTAGSFLGEYQAGGVVLVLGIGVGGKPPIEYFCGTGMHGGCIILRCNEAPFSLPEQISCMECSADDMVTVEKYAARYCECFHAEKDSVLAGKFYILRPNTKNPYKQLYINV